MADLQNQAASQVRVMRVGEFVVGDSYCPNLYGHPGVRYHY